jgi:type II secretory pathway pseudopilin PulG
MIIVIAIVALTAALVMPNLSRMISRNTTQTVFFEFQNQMTQLRARAFREKQALLLVSSGEFVEDPEADPSPAEIQFMDSGWTYQLTEPMVITAGGVCAPVNVNIYKNEDLALSLEGRPDCGFRQVAR